MEHQQERCARAAQLTRIDEAFRRGDLEALRAAVDDPASIPNGPMPDAIGSCLVSAICLSPRAFIGTLLDAGADPRAPVDDGFPPLIAALSCGRTVMGANRRDDVNDVIRLLLSRGADPNERGINDYTPLHMAVGERNAFAVQLLLEGGADPSLRTRIDACETPLEMATAAGQTEIAAILARRGAPLAAEIRPGLTLLVEATGAGSAVRRLQRYVLALRLWLRHGEPVRWTAAGGAGGRLEDEGTLLVTDVRVDRRSLVAGLFHGIAGMRVGGTRRLRIAPHLAYGDRGVPGVVPAGALLTAEVTIRSSATDVS